jgi:hypothetical protein
MQTIVKERDVTTHNIANLILDMNVTPLVAQFQNIVLHSEYPTTPQIPSSDPNPAQESIAQPCSDFHIHFLVVTNLIRSPLPDFEEDHD